MVLFYCYAEVAEWQTQQTQNLPPSKRAGSSPAAGSYRVIGQNVLIETAFSP